MTHSNGVAFSVMVQTVRGRQAAIGCTSLDTVGTIAREAARHLNQRVGKNDSATLATVGGDLVFDAHELLIHPGDAELG